MQKLVKFHFNKKKTSDLLTSGTVTANTPSAVFFVLSKITTKKVNPIGDQCFGSGSTLDPY